MANDKAPKSPAPDLQFRPVHARRISDEIGEQIRLKLVTEQLKPGDKLPPERELAAQLGVSRNTVREALRSLEMAGLLTMQKGAQGGAFIGHGDPEAVTSGLRILFQLRGITIEQLTEARIWISEIVTRIACDRATQEDYDRLDQNVRDAEGAFESGNMREKLAIQMEFHNLLARATHNPVLMILTETLVEMMRTFAEDVGPEHNDIAIASRQRLMPMLLERDTEGATAEMTGHLEALRDRYVQVAREREAGLSARATPRAVRAKA